MPKLSTDRLNKVGKNLGESSEQIDILEVRYEKISEFMVKNSLPADTDKIVEIDPQLIDTNRNISGRIVDKASERYKSFLLSIETDGLLQPPTIYAYEGKIVCKFGNHRVEACKDLGHKAIKCIFLSKNHISDDYDSPEDEDRKFMENHQSRKNSPLVYAQWVRLKADQGLSNEQIGVRLGKDREWVRRYIKISEWPESVKSYISRFENHFNQSFLHGLAKRSTIEEQDLLRLLKEKVTGKKSDPKKRAGAVAGKGQNLLDRFDVLCSSDDELKKHSSVIKRALNELNLL